LGPITGLASGVASLFGLGAPAAPTQTPSPWEAQQTQGYGQPQQGGWNDQQTQGIWNQPSAAKGNQPQQGGWASQQQQGGWSSQPQGVWSRQPETMTIKAEPTAASAAPSAWLGDLGQWISSFFGGSNTTNAPAKASLLPAQLGPTPTPAPEPNSMIDGNSEETNMHPRYVQCEGNTWNGRCPSDLLCVGDPRTSMPVNAICVPSKLQCGGASLQGCPNNFICVSDPRTPNW
jgi:hypothetical protein